MISNNSPTSYSTSIFSITITGVTAVTHDIMYADRPTSCVIRLAKDRRTIVSDFIERTKIWLAYASERARARKLFEQQSLLARRVEPAPETPGRLPRGRVTSGASRYRVMFY